MGKPTWLNGMDKILTPPCGSLRASDEDDAERAAVSLSERGVQGRDRGEESSIEGSSNPRCCCGAEMKKVYSKPVLRELDKDAAVVAEFSRAEHRH